MPTFLTSLRKHRRSHLSALFPLVFYLVTAGVFAKAEENLGKAGDVLVFTNGDQLTGRLIRSLGDKITFKSDMAGEIIVPLAKIRELRSGGEFAVLRKGQPPTKVPAKMGTIAVTDEKLSVTRAPDQVEAVPTEQLAYVVDEPSYTKAINNRGSFLSGWNGAVIAGATLIRATENSTTLTAGAALVREVPGVAFLPPHNARCSTCPRRMAS